jgi:hypothetical protein
MRQLIRNPPQALQKRLDHADDAARTRSTASEPPVPVTHAEGSVWQCTFPKGFATSTSPHAW